MRKDKLSIMFIMCGSGMIYVYLIVRQTSQTKIFELVINEPVILREKVIDTG